MRLLTLAAILLFLIMPTPPRATAQLIDASGAVQWVCDGLNPPEDGRTPWERLGILPPAALGIYTDWVQAGCDEHWSGNPPIDDYYTITIPINWTSAPENRDSPRYDIPITGDPMRAILVESGGGSGNMQARIAPDGTESVSHQYPAGQDACVARTVSDRVSCSLTGFDDPWNAGGSNNWYLDEISDGAYIRFSNTAVFGQSTSTVVSVTFVYWGIPPIDARIHASAVEGPAPLTVQFTDISIGHEARRWSFPDGSTFEDMSAVVSYTFTTPGTYYIALAVIRYDDMMADATYIEITVEDGDGVICLNRDSNLRDPAAWLTTGSVTWLDDGVVLGPNARIKSRFDILLDPDTTHTVTALVEPATEGEDIRVGVQLGSEDVLVATPLFVFQQSFPPPITPDVGDFSSFSISNLARNSRITIKRLCLDNGVVRVTPPTCGFANFNFERMLAEWDHDPEVHPGIVAGEIGMPDGSRIWQRVHLVPGEAEAHDYGIYAVLQIGYKDNAVYLADSVNSISVEYEYGLGEGFQPLTAPNSSTSFPLSLFRAPQEPSYSFRPDGSVIFRGNISINTEANEIFTIRAVSTDEDTVVRLREICIDDEFSHHESPWQELIPPTCRQRPSMPVDNANIGGWLWWHWENLNNFFTCDLMILLNQMYDLGLSAYQFVVWQFLYGQATLIGGVNWLGDEFTPWLGAHFNNMAQGNTTFITAESSTTIWDVLMSVFGIVQSLADTIMATFNDMMAIVLDTAQRLIDMVFELLELAWALLGEIVLRVLGFVIALGSQLFLMILEASGLLLSIIETWHSAVPEPLPGVPSCSTMHPSSHALCTAWWIMDNTFIAHPIGALIIPIFTSVFAIHMILWAAYEIRRAVIQTGLGS